MKKRPLKQHKVCDCKCHNPESGVCQNPPCCDFTFCDYMDEYGIDLSEWSALFKEMHGTNPLVKETTDGVYYKLNN